MTRREIPPRDMTWLRGGAANSIGRVRYFPCSLSSLSADVYRAMHRLCRACGRIVPACMRLFGKDPEAGKPGGFPRGSAGNRQDFGPVLTVVAMVADERDRRLLANIGSRRHIDLYFADGCDEALTSAHRLDAPVVLCDRDLSSKEWRDLVQLFASTRQRPSVILISKVVDEYLRQEVILHGGYDVVAKPLREEDVVRSLKLAWSYWHSAMKMPPRPADGSAKKSGLS